MLYYKIVQGEKTVTAEAHENPVYVCRQANGVLVRCSEGNAQGILSLDGSTVYQLNGKPSLDLEDGYTAYEIYGTEYEEIIAGLSGEGGGKDPEDTDPVVPGGTDENTVLTRAELTVKVTVLEDELKAAKILLGVE